MQFEAIMMSCVARESVRKRSIAALAATDWRSELRLVIDEEAAPTPLLRVHHTWRRVIQLAATLDAEFVLMLEDDVTFCGALLHNLEHWPLLRRVASDDTFFASLYNPGRPYLHHNKKQHYRVAHADSMWGAQALLCNPNTARYLVRHWTELSANPDVKMPKLVSRVAPVYYHSPSLVDHMPVPTTWGGIEHRAIDFDPNWRATSIYSGM